MQRGLFVIVAVSAGLAGLGHAQQPLRAMSHPQLSGNLEHGVTVERTVVNPVSVSPLNFSESRRNFDDADQIGELHHLDFSSRPLNDYHHLSDTFNEHRNNERYSNMRLQFEDQRLEHLNFNAQ